MSLTTAAAATAILNNALGLLKSAREQAKGSNDIELKEISPRRCIVPQARESPSYQGYVSPPGPWNEPLLPSEDTGYEIRSTFACVAA